MIRQLQRAGEWLLSGDADMTLRARLFLGVAAIRNLGLGAVTHMADADAFDGSAFIGLEGIFSLAIWSWLFFVVSAVITVAAVFRREGIAHFGLLLSILLGGSWFGSFFAALMVGSLRSHIILVLLGALIAKDLIVIRNPLVDPLERLAESTRLR